MGWNRKGSGSDGAGDGGWRGVWEDVRWLGQGLAYVLEYPRWC